MIKKLVNVVALVLALNFIVAAAGTAWVWKSGRVDHEKLKAIRDVLYPPESQPVSQPTTVATSQPISRLDELLARASGRPASEQVEFIRETFAGENAELDRQRRELTDLQRQIELARDQAATDRAKVEQDRIALANAKQDQAKLMNDEGFQNSLALYEIMPAAQVKTIFMTLEEPVVTSYLQAMPPARAAKIVKEFESAEELDRIRKVLERLRQPPTTLPVSTAGT